MGWVRIWTGARYIGTDQAGNQYYEAKPRPGTKRPRRYVRYKTSTEATNVPPEWHGWLHYQTDAIPSGQAQTHRREWQKPHQPNLTGTAQAYRPPGHILSRWPPPQGHRRLRSLDPAAIITPIEKGPFSV
jgi:NADH:ubiquinone oxidoreductase subunit